MSVIDDYIEGLLKQKDMFEYVIPKAVLYLNLPQGRQRIYHVMALRLGHVTGNVVLWKDIAKQTLHSRDSTRTVSKTYCMALYKRGLRMARRLIEEEGKQ